MISKYSQVPTYLVYTGLILGALIFIPIPQLAFTLPKVTIFAYTALFGAIALLQCKEKELSVSGLIHHWKGRFFLLFFCVTLLSLAWSVAPVLSIVGAPPRFEGVLTYSIFFILALTACQFSQEDQKRKALINVMFLSNAAVVLYGVLQIFGLDPFSLAWEKELFLGRTFSTIGQPNFLGQFILLTLPFVGFKFHQADTRQYRSLLFAMVVCNLIVLVSTASRGALLGLVFMVLLGVALYAKNLRSISKKNLLLCCMSILIIGAIGSYFLGNRFSVSTQNGFSLGSRGVIWNSAVNMIRQRPLGYGLETTAIALQQFMRPEIYEYESLTTSIDRAHSKPLDLFITLGPLGFISYYVFLFVLMIGLWRKRREHSLCAPLLLSLTGFSVSLLVGFEGIVGQNFFWVIVGMALGVTLYPLSRSSRRSPIPVMLFILSIMSVFTFTLWTRARIHMAQAERHLVQGGYASAVRGYAKAVNLFPFDRSLLIQSAETALLAQEQADNQQTRDTLRTVVKQSLATLSTLTANTDGMIIALSVWQEALEGNRKNVQTYSEELIRLQPVSIVSLRILAHSFALLGDDEQTRKVYQRIALLLPSFWKEKSSERGRILWKEHPWLEILEEAR